MNDALLVRRFECLGQAGGDPQRFIGRNRTTCEALRERRSLDQLHDERHSAVGALETVHVGNVRVAASLSPPVFGKEERWSLA
jgi:hypothetical protein